MIVVVLYGIVRDRIGLCGLYGIVVVVLLVIDAPEGWR